MGSIPIFSTLKMKELQKSKSVTLFFLPEFCQKMREKWGRGVEISGRNGDKFEIVVTEGMIIFVFTGL